MTDPVQQFIAVLSDPASELRTYRHAVGSVWDETSWDEASKSAIRDALRDAVSPKIMKRKSARGGLSQYWTDEDGPIRLMALVEGYAVMRRPGAVPFLVPAKELSNGARGLRSGYGVDFQKSLTT